MSDDDLEYLPNYIPNHLYKIPARKGAFAKIVGDSEQVIDEIDVTSRCKLAVSVFYVNGQADFDTLKITKLQLHKTRGWREDGQVSVNRFQAAQMREFISILSSLDLSDAQKTRISLENIHIGALGTLLSSTQGAALLKELARSPELHQDIYAVAAKRAALAEFERSLAADLPEVQWQEFFERNSWIFGHGLNYVFLNKVSKSWNPKPRAAPLTAPASALMALCSLAQR